MTDNAKTEAPDETSGATQVEATGTDDSLEALLQDYAKAEAQKTEAPTPAKTPPSDDAIAAYLKAQGIDPEKLKKAIHVADKTEAKEIDHDFTTGLNHSVSRMTEAQPELDGLPKTVLRGILWDAAHQDKRIAEAFADRDAKPENWSKIVDKLAKTAVKDFSATKDTGKTALRSAIKLAGSITGGSDDQSESERIANLPGNEFLRAMQKRGSLVG